MAVVKKWTDFIYSSQLVFQLAMLVRPMGLLVFTILIARRWPIQDIAQFETLNLAQYFVFFTWLPSWGLILLKESATGNIQDQKSYLFSNTVFGLAISLLLTALAFLFRKQLLPIDFGWQTGLKIVFSFIYFFICQVSIYRIYTRENTKALWINSGWHMLFWMVLYLFANDFGRYLDLMAVAGMLFLLLEMAQHTFSIPVWYSSFWKQTFLFGLYLTIGASISILVAYVVQHRYGVDQELTWYRYATREIPLLPILLSGVGLVQFNKMNSGIEEYCKAVKNAIKTLSYLLLPAFSIVIVFCTYFMGLLYGPAFVHIGILFSLNLLVYIPKLIPSNMILQFHTDSMVLISIAVMEWLFVLMVMIVFYEKLSLVHYVLIPVLATMLERILQMGALSLKYKIRPSSYLSIRSLGLFSFILLLLFLLTFII